MAESIARAWFRRVWNEQDEGAIEELFAKEGVAKGIYGDVIRGPAEFRQFRQAICSLFRDIHFEVVDEVWANDRIAVRCEAKMIHQASQKEVPLIGTSFLEVKGGQIHQAWDCWNFLGLLESLDLMPKGSFDLAMSGALSAHPSSGLSNS